jgi:hypothetical protein
MYGRVLAVALVAALFALLAAGSVLAATGSAAALGGKRAFATLTGAAEVPGPGDPDGRGAALIRLQPGKERVCYQLAVSQIAPATAAHIHEGPAGVAGPVVVELPLNPVTNGASAGCVSLDRAEIRAILRNPSNYYVNVHNAPFPDGAVRGQLRR